MNLNKNYTKSLRSVFSIIQSLLMQIYQIKSYSDVSINAKTKQKRMGDK